MQVSYQISEEDFVAAASLCRRKQNRTLFFMQVVGGSVLAYFLYEMWIGTVPLRSWPGGLVPAMMLVLPFYVDYQFHKQYRKLIALQEPRTMIVDTWGVTIESASLKAQSTWSTYIRFFEDKRSFALLQQGSLTFVPIPKRELSANQIEALRVLFEAHIRAK